MDRPYNSGMSYNLSTADRIYIQSERWKCSESPTGAHHYICLNNLGNFTCKYCQKRRRFPTNINEALKLNQPAKLVDFMMSEDSYSLKGKGNNGKKNIQYGRKFLPKDGSI